MRFPATSQDQVHDLARLIADQQIQIVMEFEGRIDAARLERSMRLLLDAEPILGCQFVGHPWRPYWERRNDLDQLVLCPVTETTRPSQDAMAFAARSIDSGSGAQVQARVFRGERDTLCIKVDHTATDATGAKEVTYKLADIYRRLGDDPAYRPTPNSHGSRSQDQVLSRFSLWEKWHAVRLTPSTAPEWGFPSNGGEETTGRAFVVRRLSPECLAALRKYGKHRRATVNDLLITAFYRSLFEVIKPVVGPPLAVMIPVDLRRYLPSGKAGAICNLSGAFLPSVARIPGESFEQSLGRVCSAVNAMKASRAGLGGVISLSLALRAGFGPMGLVARQMRGQSVRHGTANPVLSNFGLIDADLLSFGEVTLRDAYMLGPTLFAPGLMLAVSTFAGQMAFAIGAAVAATESCWVACLLDAFERELRSVAVTEST